MGSLHGGDKVIFSKPVDEIVAPHDPDALPIPGADSEVRHLDLSGPETPMPYIPPPMRNDLRRRDRDRKNILGDPLNPFKEPKESDKSDQDRFANDKDPSTNSAAFALVDPMRKREQDRALSPVRQFDWSPDDSSLDKNKKSAREKLLHFGDEPSRNDKGFFGARRKSEDDTGSGSVFDFFRKNSDRDDDDRDRDVVNNDFTKGIEFTSPVAAPESTFAKLPSPTASPFESAKSAAPVMVPIPAPLPERRSLAPVQSYNDQKSWGAPSVDDINRKAQGIGPQAPVRMDPFQSGRPPLLRAPLNQDIPSRRF